MKKNSITMLAVFITISYLSVPGMAGIFPANSYSILFQRLVAALILISVIVYKGDKALLDSILDINRSTAQLMSVIIAFSALAIPFVYMQSDVDTARSKVFGIIWTTPLIVFYGIISSVYFIIYELAIRGIFLNTLKRSFSVSIAVLLNVLVYAMMHLPKGIQETAACIPFGLLLCVVTIHTRSILPAMIMHVCLGVALEGSIIYQINYKILQP